MDRYRFINLTNRDSLVKQFASKPIPIKIAALRVAFLVIGISGLIVWIPSLSLAANVSGSPARNSDAPKSGQVKPMDLTAALSLTDCVQIALENSMQLGATQYDLQIAELIKKDTDGIYWPRIKGGVDFVTDDGTKSDSLDQNQVRPFLTITQRELNTGENYKKLRDAATQLTEAKVDLLKAKRKLIATVAESYFAVYLNQKQLELDQKEMIVQKRHLKDLQLKYKDGMVAQIETLEAETELAAKELQFQKDSNALTHSIMVLAVVMGLPAEKRLKIGEIDSDEPFHITWEQCRNMGLQNNIELEIYEQAAEEMKRLRKSASRTRWPTLSAKAYMGENPPQGLSPDADIGATLTLSQNLYDAGETQRRISRATIEMKQYQVLVRHFRQTFINDLRLLYNQFADRKEELALATQKHRLAEKLFDVTQSSYELGNISLKEKRNAEQTVRRSEIMYNRAKVNYMAAEIKLKIEMRNDPWQNQN
jgi:outer membrane protein TolC